MRCGSRMTLYCRTKPPTLATSATPSALASANFRFQSWIARVSAEVQLFRHHGILVDPADAGGVRTHRRRHAGGQAGGGAVEEFEHARARPIDVGAVLEDDVDERHAEEREPAHHFRARHRQHRRGQGIGDLVLDHLRRLAGIFGVDDHLGVGEIGDGVERQMRQRIDAGGGGKAGAEQHQQQIARRPGDQAGDHGCAPASEKPLSAAFRLLSASIRKFAETTTGSPSADALAHLDIAAAAMAELDLARLETAFALVDQHRLAPAGVHHGALGNGQHRRGAADVDVGIDIHAVQQHQIRIAEFNAQPRGARLLADLGIDDVDFA